MQTRPDPNLIEGTKFNLGCGFDIRPGWINVDLHGFHKPDLICDVTWLKPIEDARADYVLAQDLLEHIHRNRCLTALREWNRVLKLGGFLEIRVPDVVTLGAMLAQPENADPKRQAVLLQCMFGTQGYEGDFHYNGFTEPSLHDAFKRSGFALEYLGHKDEWLFEVVGRKIEHCPPEPMLRETEDSAFLQAAYQLYLKREPDDEGRAFWLDRLMSGTPREVVAAQIEAAAALK